MKSIITILSLLVVATFAQAKTDLDVIRIARSVVQSEKAEKHGNIVEIQVPTWDSELFGGFYLIRVTVDKYDRPLALTLIMKTHVIMVNKDGGASRSFDEFEAIIDDNLDGEIDQVMISETLDSAIGETIVSADDVVAKKPHVETWQGRYGARISAATKAFLELK